MSVAMDVALAVLGDGYTSRLRRDVQERLPFVHRVGTDFLTQREPGLAGVSAVCDPQRVAETRQALQAVVEGLRAQPVRRAELDKAKRVMARNFAFANETYAEQAETLGFYEALIGYRFACSYLRSVERVTAARCAARRPAVPGSRPLHLGHASSRRSATLGTALRCARRGRPLRSLSPRAARRGPCRAAPGRLRECELAAPRPWPALRLRAAGGGGAASAAGDEVRDGATAWCSSSSPAAATDIVAVHAFVRVPCTVETEQAPGIRQLLSQMLVRGTTQRTAPTWRRPSRRPAARSMWPSGWTMWTCARRCRARGSSRRWSCWPTCCATRVFDAAELERQRAEALARLDAVKDDPFQSAYFLARRGALRGPPLWPAQLRHGRGAAPHHPRAAGGGVPDLLRAQQHRDRRGRQRDQGPAYQAIARGFRLLAAGRGPAVVARPRSRRWSAPASRWSSGRCGGLADAGLPGAGGLAARLPGGAGD